MNNISTNCQGEMQNGAWISNYPLFKSLTKKEVEEFRVWAQDNYDTEPRKDNPCYHPVIREEFAKIAAERIKS